VSSSKISEIFNETFSSAIKNNGSNSKTTTIPTVIDPPICSLFLRPVDQNEIKKIIASLKNKNSCGVDEIPPMLIKQCIDELAEPLSILINQSFQQGVFPDLLKLALIKPIHKKDDPTSPENYRPIALLSSFSKIFEKAMCNRLYTFLEKFNILDEHQNGFRKSKSTTSAVYQFIQTALNHLNEKRYGLGILLDMSKAYESVNYDILLSKLYGSGIRGPSYFWFKSYLENRKQKVQIEYFNTETNEIKITFSEEIKLTGSIPQGSVLGCVLFLIYINDLPKIIKNEDTLPILFADDLSVLIKCNDTKTINDVLTSTIQKITSWLKQNNLSLNYTKTKIMQFRPYNKAPLDINQLIFDNNIIQSVGNFNLLGIVIDTHLNWKQHIQQVKSKLSKFSYALFELRHSTTKEAALSAYYAYAYSQLKYGIILWGNSTNINDLFVMQKKTNQDNSPNRQHQILQAVLHKTKFINSTIFIYLRYLYLHL
jgi:hypothetical protein